MRDRLLAALRVGTLAGIYVLLLLVARGVVGAQVDVPDARVEAISRVTVGEEGFTITDGHAAITHLLVRRGVRLGLTPRQMARAYSSLHFDRARTDRRRWIADLTLDAHQPLGWPRGPRWSRYAPRWLAVVEHVRAALRGEVPDPCEEPPDHWAASSIDRSGWGWRRVDCGNARNVFWRIARRGDGA